MLERKQIGETETYKGHEIVVRHLGPDLLCYVDSIELNAFYETADSARRSARKYIDEVERQKKTGNLGKVLQAGCRQAAKNPHPEESQLTRGR